MEAVEDLMDSIFTQTQTHTHASTHLETVKGNSIKDTF